MHILAATWLEDNETHNLRRISIQVKMSLVKWDPGPLSTENTPPYCYRDSRYKPEAVVTPSYVYNVDSYTLNAASF